MDEDELVKYLGEAQIEIRRLENALDASNKQVSSREAELEAATDTIKQQGQTITDVEAERDAAEEQVSTLAVVHDAEL